MDSFCLTEDEWMAASAELVSIGRGRSDGDRESIETICSTFILSRSDGKRLPRPKHHSEAWKKVEAAARQLRDRITEIANDPEAVDVWSFLSHDVPTVIDHVISMSEYLARIEAMGPKHGNAADPAVNWLQRAIIGFWESCGGNVGASNPSDGSGEPYGPLIRFLSSTYSPALEGAGLRRPSPTALREIIRAYQGNGESKRE